MIFCCSVTKSCPTPCNRMNCHMPGFPVLHCLSELARTHAHWVSDTINHLILCHPLLLPSIFPSIMVFSNELALHMRWPKYCSFSISPSNECSRLISFRIDWFDLLAIQGTLKSLSSTTVWKHQFFGTQPSLWSNTHIHTWLLEKPLHCLYGPLSAKWCLRFLICCLGLPLIFFQGASVF